MKKLALLFAAALVLCAAAVLADRRRRKFCIADHRGGARGASTGWGRSLGIRLLPLFVLFGMARGMQEQHVVVKEMCMQLDAERTYGEGRIVSVGEKEAWTVLLLKQVSTKEGRLRYLQVYVERDLEGTGNAENQDDRAKHSAEKTENRNAEKIDSDRETEVRAEQRAPYRIGESVRVWGEFTAFQPASNPGAFDYAAYYRGEKLVWRVFARSVRNIDGKSYGLSRPVDGLANMLWHVRGWASDRLKLLAGEEDGGIFAAMLLGEKGSMSEEIRDLYQKNGIAHLLAVSGLHLSLVSMAAYGFLRRAGAGYGKAAVAGGTILVFYCMLTGASPSVLRAMVMTLCGFLAAYLGRTYDLLSAMGLSALLLLWYSPYLMDQAGVQLSFAAIGGIGLARDLEKGGKMAASVWEQTMRMTLCMQLVSLPVVLWHFFAYPLYGIFLNLLVVPLAGIIVGTGAGGLLASLFRIQAGAFLTGGGRAVLAWYTFCCRCFMRLPGCSLLMGRPELWQIVLYYLVLGIALQVGSENRMVAVCGSDRRGGKQPNLEYTWQTGNRPDLRYARQVRIVRKIALKTREYLLVIALLAGLVCLHTPAVRGLEVTILDTGQGDGICIRTKNQVILVDGGSTDQKKLGEYSLEPFLRSKGIRFIDLAIVSHGDWDHISGLSWLMEQAAEKGKKGIGRQEAAGGEDAGFVKVKTLVLPEKGKGEEVYENLKRLCEQQGGHVIWAARGDGWKEAGDGILTLTCLYPERNVLSGGDSQIQAARKPMIQMPQTFRENHVETDRNEHSLVFLLDYRAFHMMLTGDMSAKGEEELIRLEKHEAEDMSENVSEYMDGSRAEKEDIWILKTAHHGSAYSSSEAFLSWLDPDCAVISCGKKNRYGHPHPDTIKRLTDCGSKILLTTENGAIIWKTDGHRVWLKTMKRGAGRSE